MMCIIFLDEYKSHVYRFADEHKLDRSLIGLFFYLSHQLKYYVLLAEVAVV